MFHENPTTLNWGAGWLSSANGRPEALFHKTASSDSRRSGSCGSHTTQRGKNDFKN
jgi:hypothetical protein